MTLLRLAGYLLLTGWVAFEVGRRVGRASTLIRARMIHRRTVDTIVRCLQATPTHGGDCDQAFRTLAAVVLDQQVELLAYRGYTARLEAGSDLGEEIEEFLAEGGGGS